MDSNNFYTTLFSLLLAVAVCASYNMQGFPQFSVHSGLDQQISNCNKLNPPTVSANAASGINSANRGGHSPINSEAGTFSCNTSLQTIPVEKHLLYPPAESATLLRTYKPSLYLQSFVYQEPDPPQFSY